MITVIGGQLANVIGGTVIMENIFNIPGMGQLALTALNGRDYPVVSAIVLLVINLGFRNHDPAKLWVNQMKRRARRVALVYPAGVPAAEKWLKAQKKSLEQEFAKTEEYALPKGTPAEETAELVASLKAREDLSEVRQPKAGK